MTQTNFWKSHPNMDKFSRNGSSSCPDILQKLSTHKKIMDEFSRIGPAHAPEIEISKKYWMSFPGKPFQGLSIRVNNAIDSGIKSSRIRMN